MCLVGWHVSPICTPLTFHGDHIHCTHHHRSLYGNSLQTIPESFEGLTGLWSLSHEDGIRGLFGDTPSSLLNNNQLISLPDVFDGMTRLSYLYAFDIL